MYVYLSVIVSVYAFVCVCLRVCMFVCILPINVVVSAIRIVSAFNCYNHGHQKKNYLLNGSGGVKTLHSKINLDASSFPTFI